MAGKVHLGASRSTGVGPARYAAVTEYESYPPVVYLQSQLACCRWLTAAQLIVILNAVCFMAHFSLFTTTLVYLLGWDGKEHHLWAPVYRLRANWTDPSVSGYRLDLVENGTGFNIGVFTAVWFGLTAGFHFLALVAGTCRPLWGIYFVQLVRSARSAAVRGAHRAHRLRTTPLRGGGGWSTPSPPLSW